MRSLPRCYKQDSWSNELVVRLRQPIRNLSMEAENIVGIRHGATTDEDTAY
jgi:hypothetical protein